MDFRSVHPRTLSPYCRFSKLADCHVNVGLLQHLDLRYDAPGEGGHFFRQEIVRKVSCKGRRVAGRP
jgi:hypothetical protein